MPPTSKICATIFSRLSKPVYLKIASTGDSFSLENRCALPILSSFTMMNDLPSGSWKPAFSAIRWLFAEDPRLGLSEQQIAALVADPVEFTGAARDQVASVVRRVEAALATDPEAAGYVPGAIL